MDIEAYEDNHLSARNYPLDVDKYIQEELKIGSLVGPFTEPPFEFFHCSPLMSREKNDTTKRRIITDVRYPDELSVNSFIPTNTIMGKMREHKLPRSDDVVKYINMQNDDYWLSSLDMANAYKHWFCCPSDYPLFTIKWKGQYYIEVTIPFGARNSSLIQQTISNAILDILNH